MKTGRDAVVAALLGAEEYVFGTAGLVAEGCVMARQCHKNTCPVGVATQDEDLRTRFPGQPEHVINYMTFMAQEMRELMAELGFRTVEEMIGQTHVLRQRDDVTHPKARQVDLSSVIADPGGSDARYKTREQRHEIDEQLDWELLDVVEEHLDSKEPVEVDAHISNVDRAVGATLSNKVSLRYAAEGLPDDTVTVNFDGAAGQSFGAFLAPGLTFRLSGVANDYFGKGLSGGKLIATTPDGARFDPTENTLIGNVALYGATGGQAYINGVAGERFAVRNSGVRAVVEGVGDHGCEYMTSGMVVVIGETGKNFAAGMSGGIAYVWDPDGEFADRANTDMVRLTGELEASDEQAIRRLVENHAAHTGSDRARELLDAWELVVDQFVKVMPDAYREAIEERPEADARRSLPEPATAASGPRAPESAD
jgi:glutamate synthase (NADPH/NADH) large chain